MGRFTRLAYSPDGKRIAIAGRQGGGEGRGILRLYDFTTKKVYLVFVEDVGKELIAVSWPVADKILAVGWRGKNVKLVTVQLKKSVAARRSSTRENAAESWCGFIFLVLATGRLAKRLD